MKNKKITSIFLLLCALSFTSVAVNANDMDIRFAQLEKDINEVNESFGAINNDMIQIKMFLDRSASRPVVIQETTMLEMAADSPEAKAMTAMDTKSVEEQHLQVICSSPMTKELIDVRAFYKVLVKDKNGEELIALSFDLKKCEK